jgi:adenylosuccinate lyase
MWKGANVEGELWQHPLASRYASKEMLHLFSERNTAVLWRTLWHALAEAERGLGVGIPREAVEDMARHLEDVDLQRVHEIEKETRHDVVAHIRHFAEVAPKAAAFIHYGATSCFVADNASLVQMKEGLGMLAAGAAGVLRRLARFAEKHKGLPVLGFTHFQPAQPTTLGKRACLWIQDLLLDIQALEDLIEKLPFRSIKGATGTQAAFLQLLGSYEKVRQLEGAVARKMGFERVIPVSGQTYTRKIDSTVLAALAGIGESGAKFGNDIRLLQHMKEVEEPFGKSQVGSSAMPYKRNPMRSERLCGLGRFLAGLAGSAYEVSTTQWLERTLDDSAPRRFYLPEAFLTADACLMLYGNIADGLLVYPEVIARHLQQELPFMAVETVLTAAVEKGGDRQVLHERIRVHAQEAAAAVKERGKPNDLLGRLAADPAFDALKDELPSLADPARFIGAAPDQVAWFLEKHVEPVVSRYPERGAFEVEV